MAKQLVDKTHMIVLEYAPGGTLATFCKRNLGLITSPGRENRLNLWYQMFHLLQALTVIHEANG